MRKKVAISEVGEEMKKDFINKLEESLETTKEIQEGFEKGVVTPTVDFEFKYALGKALAEEKVILMAKPERYRGTGKTVLMSSYLFMKEDMYLVVSDMAKAKMYYPYVPKDRIIVISQARQGFKGRRVRGGFILDEISYKDYQEVVQLILRPMGKVMGIVSIYKDYEIL